MHYTSILRIMRKDRRRDVKIPTKISSLRIVLMGYLGYADSLLLVGRYCTVPTFFGY